MEGVMLVISRVVAPFFWGLCVCLGWGVLLC
jgi:hypothetical protein